MIAIFKKIFCAFAYYYDGQYHKFLLNEQGDLVLSEVEKPSSAKILILARKYYQESVKTYPLTNKKEITKLLAMESLVSEQSHIVWQAKEEQTTVNLWLFDKDAPRGGLTLPESLLLAMTINEKEIVEYSGKQNAFLCRFNQAVYSSIKSSLISNSYFFAQSVGISENDSEQIITSNAFAEKLVQGIAKLPINLLTSFFAKVSDSTKSLIALKVFVPIVSVFSLYLVLSSAYLVINNISLKSELDSRKEVINSALDQQQKYDQNSRRYQQLQKFYQSQSLLSPFWLVITDITPNSELTNLRLINDRFVMRGKAEKATTILEQVNNLAYVADAKFDFPTRQVRGKESFVISFTLTDDAVKQSIRAFEEANTINENSSISSLAPSEGIK